jgi:hypothetical protein
MFRFENELVFMKYFLFLFKISFWFLPFLLIIKVLIIIFYYLKVRQNIRDQSKT